MIIKSAVPVCQMYSKHGTVFSFKNYAREISNCNRNIEMLNSNV